MKKKLLAIVSVAGLMFLMTSGKAWAEQVVSSLIVSPPYQRVILVPGETYKGEIQVANSNDNKNILKYAASVGSFREVGDDDGKDDYGTVDHVTRSDKNQIMDWIKLGKEKGSVAPNETDVLTYTIEVPKDAPAGGQYATIIIRDETNDSEDTNGNVAIQNVIQFASIIYAEVAGETREAGEILENLAPSVVLDGPFQVSSMVKNSGNVHTDAEYILQVWPLFSDDEIYSNEEEPMKSLILPDSERYNVQTWDKSPAVGIFRVKQTVKIYDDVSTVEKLVIICPLWLIIVIVLGIFAIIAVIVAKIRKNTRKKS